MSQHSRSPPNRWPPPNEEGAEHYGAARLLTCQSRHAAAQPPPRQRGALLPAARRGARPPRGDRLPGLAPRQGQQHCHHGRESPSEGARRQRPGGRRSGAVRTRLACLLAELSAGSARRAEPQAGPSLTKQHPTAPQRGARRRQGMGVGLPKLVRAPWAIDVPKTLKPPVLTRWRTTKF